MAIRIAASMIRVEKPAGLVRVRYVNTFPAVKSRGSTTMITLNWKWLS